jgi:hypothetical protein
MNHDVLHSLGKTGVGDRNRILADRDRAEFERSVGIGGSLGGPFGRFRPEHHHSSLNGTMLGVMNDSADGTEDGSEGGSGEQERNAKDRNTN